MTADLESRFWADCSGGGAGGRKLGGGRCDGLSPAELHILCHSKVTYNPQPHKNVSKDPNASLLPSALPSLNSHKAGEIVVNSAGVIDEDAGSL